MKEIGSYNTSNWYGKSIKSSRYVLKKDKGMYEIDCEDIVLSRVTILVYNKAYPILSMVW